MKSLNPSPENSRRSGVIGLGLIPGQGPAVISLKVSHGHNHYEVAVPSNTSFGYLKSVISQSLGLKPETCKLFFGGMEKQDEESLQLAGLKDNSEVLLVESVHEQVPEEVQEIPVASKGEEAVAEARKDIDKLEQQVSALQAVIDSGKKVEEKEIMYLTEMLMRQLLNLDGIEAEGEGRVQRKTEVRRVQNIVETLDALKSRNLNSSNHTQRSVSASSEWRAFDPSPSPAGPAPPPASAPLPSPAGSAHPPAPTLSPSPAGSAHPPAPTPSPSPAGPAHPPALTLSTAPPVVSPSFPSPMPSPLTYPVPYPTPSNIPPPTFGHIPHFSHSNYQAMPYPVPAPMQYFTPSTPQPFQYYDPAQYYAPSQYYDPTQMAYSAYPTVPSSAPAPAPAPASAPYHVPSSNPFSMPSSTKVTENWEHFG